MFDHNLSPWIPRALSQLFHGTHEIVPLRDKFDIRTPDIAWIEQLNAEDKWVVISGDRRITKNRAEFEAFRRSRLVGFFLSPGLHKAKVIKQTERILAQWESIEKQVALVRGSAMFELQMKGTQLRQIKGQ